MNQIPYVIVALLIICTALSIIFYMAYIAFGRPAHARTWSISFGLAAVQWAFNIFYMVYYAPTASEYSFFDYFYWMVVNVIGAIVPVLGIAGYMQRAGKALNIPILAAIVIVPVLSTAWFTYIDYHAGLLTGLLPLSTSVLSFWAAWIVYDLPRKKRPIEWGLITAYCTLAIMEIIIGSLGLAQGADGDPVIVGYFRNVLFLTLPGAFAVLGMFALAIIASDLALESVDVAEYQRLKRKEEKEVSAGTLQDAIEAIPDLIAINDGKGIIVTCNKAFARFLDLPQEEYSG